ncbi:ChaN family lipoprotein [Agrobacterium sp. UNC420CL41Cvi]|uniref:ChaN family lipoprotein n=2 Tax=unclassified Agrobacterium TaxID=2632611 RepID=UPI0018CC4D88|nr:ChaN family lipoprotein [Agrobacterium sp. UNC420CL41Cvi]
MIKKIYLISLMFFLAGCRPGMPVNSTADIAREDVYECRSSYVEAIYDASGRRVSVVEVIKRATLADYVLIGEVHNNIRHHNIQSHLISNLGNSGRFNSVLFEMLEPRHEDNAFAFKKGTISGKDLEKALQWTERGWPVWEAYMPIFEAGRKWGLAIAHAGMDSELMRHVNNFGFLALPRRMRTELDIQPDQELVVDFNSVKSEVAKSHAGDAKKVTRLAISQYIKDAYMAKQMVSSGSGAILIAGNGHVRKDIGVLQHLRKYSPFAKVVVIGLIENVGNDSSEGIDGREYDFLWSTIAQRCESDRPT